VTINYVKNTLNAIMVKCDKCDKEMKRIEFKNHLQDCIKPCKWNCGSQMIPAELEKHQRCCNFRQCVCSCNPKCKWEGLYLEKEAHEKDCKYVFAEKVVNKYMDDKVYNYDDYEDIGPFPHTDEELMIVKNMRACVSLKNIKKMEEEILDKFVDNEKFIKRLYSKEGQNPAQYSTSIAMMDETKVICISNNGTILEYSLYNEEYITRFNRDRSSNQHKKIEYKIHILNVKIPKSFFMGLGAVTGVISGKRYQTLNTGSYGGSYYRGTGTDHVVKLMKMIIKLKD
jgi:hypothetical protein